MNERTEALVKQAAEYAIEFAVKDQELYIPKLMEKFAELIARECMGIISDESEKVSDEWQCKDGKHIWWKIKEHFGVE